MHMIERGMTQWLKYGALPMSLPAVQFRTPLGAGLSEKYHVFPAPKRGTLFRCCVLGQDISPLNASLDSGENEYLVRRR